MKNDEARFELGLGEFIFIVIILAIVASVGLLFFAASVPAGCVGVQDTFGSVSPDTLKPGFHLKGPFTRIQTVEVKTLKYLDYGTSDKATITALSNDGLSTTMGISVNYHINEELVVPLYTNVGMGYQDVVMVNPIHSVPRDLISKYDTKTLYSASVAGTTDRARLEQELLIGIQKKMETVGVPGSIVIEQVYIRDIDFPDAYKNTITSKMNMDTEIATKRSELEKQRIEAERVVVIAEAEAAANIARAKGEAEANRIRTASLSDALLRYTWIQNLKDNKNVMYIPIDSNGMILTKNIESGASV